MRIQGFQKLTLLDFPGKTAATVFTAGCNFRCPFCHNGDLVLRPKENEDIPEDEILSVLSRRKGFLDGVCITGGEPLMWQDLPDFIRRIKELGLIVKLDTNGSYPERLDALIKEGIIDFVAMDIKNAPEAYAETVGLTCFDISPVMTSVEILKRGEIPFEFRTTAVKEFHSPHRMKLIGEWLKSDARYYIQSYRLSDGVIDKTLTPFEKDELSALLDAVKPYLPNSQIRGV